MLRYAFLTTIGLLASVVSSPAQPAPKDASPPPAAATATDAPEPMEEVQPGDHWTYEVRDEITGDVKATSTNIVTDLSETEISVRFGVTGNPNSGYVAFDRSWNVKNNGTWRFTPNDGSGFRLPLAVGKTWSFQSTDVNSTGGFSYKRSGKSKVVGQESVTTRAGTFDTFKIETSYSLSNAHDPTKKMQVVTQTWYAPVIDHWVKRSSVSRSEGRVRDNSSIELVEYGRR